MQKNKTKKQDIKSIVENALTQETFYMNGREINPIEDRVVSKRQRNKLGDPLEYCVKMTEKNVELPHNYTLSNIPVYMESRYMQKYHFEFNNWQLKNMYTTPKVIIDKWHSTFITEEGVVHRTSFFAVAPKAETQYGIPRLYRFSVTRKQNDDQHYSISVHAIVGGKDDGWLFLGRLDNGDPNLIHPVLAHFMTKRYLKNHNAVITKELNFHLIKRKEKLKVADENISKLNFCIPFPHIHQPNSHYEIGEQPERACPKFLRKCANNSFDENLAFMLKIFNISERPHYRKKDESIHKIIKEEKEIFPNETPNPQYILDDIYENEELDLNRNVIIIPKQHEKKQEKYVLQRHKSNSGYIQKL